jgi:methanethiol S-methyltransferase
MITNHLILFLIWLLYCFLHSFLAWSRVKDWFQRRLNFTATNYRIVYNCFAFLSLIAVTVFHFSIQSDSIQLPALISSYVGPVLVLIGVSLMIVCIRKYWPGLSGLNADKKNNLITSGLHAYVRHPLYLGTFIFLSGLFMRFPSYANLIGAMIIIVYTLIGIRLEEKKLEAEFGSAYLEYKKKVPSIIPFIHYK